jgi:hypothetical protein
MEYKSWKVRSFLGDVWGLEASVLAYRVRTVYEKLMGIKGALAHCVVGLSLLAAAAPLCAQDDSDDVASTRKPEDRADERGPGDPSEADRGLGDPSGDADDSADKKPVRRTKLGARALDSDSDDNSNVDRDGVEKDQDDGDAPKRDRGAAKKDKDAASKDAAKKEPAKKDADKSDKAKQNVVSKSSQKPGGCVEVSFEARYASIGYDHLVTLKSACKKAMKCVVRTNVNSEPASVALQQGGEETVVMWRGSPSRAFTPDVSCD